MVNDCYDYPWGVHNASTKPGDAVKQVITDEDGVAKFDPNLWDLDILENQTTLYFAVFYTVGDETIPAGSIGVTVSKIGLRRYQ